MGRSWLVIMIVIVLLALGGYFVLHETASEPTSPAPPAAPTPAPAP